MTDCTWGDICTLDYGKALRGCAEEPSDENRFRVFGTNGPIGWSSQSLSDGPGVIVGRKGAYRGIHFSPEPFFVIDTAYFVRPKSDKLDLKWAYYKLLTFDMDRIDVGAAIPTTSRSAFYSVPVSIPLRKVQVAVAATLSAYDELMENNRRRMALLEEAARLLYREWFVRLRFPGHEHAHITKGVPEGWERVPLGVLAEVTMGQSPESKFYNETGDGMPFHQGVADFGDRFVTNRIYTTALNRIANAGDILCSVRAPVGRLNITLDKIVIGRGLAALRSRSSNQSFLLHQLRTHFFKEDLIGAGAIFASVTKTEFRSQMMLTPPSQLIQEFEDFSGPIDEQLRVLHLQNQKLRAARDLLLPRLMSGEVSV